MATAAEKRAAAAAQSQAEAAGAEQEAAREHAEQEAALQAQADAERDAAGRLEFAEATSELTVYQRMIAILDELPAIGKTQENTQQHFFFRGHDDVLNALTPLLAKWGVLIVPDVLDRLTDQRQTRQGSVMYEVNLHVEYTCFGALGDSIKGSAWGEGTDMGDKATMKAGTMAFKAFLNQTFAINTEEGAKHDADKDTPQETVRQEVRVDPAIKPPQNWSDALKRFDDMTGKNGDGAGWLAELLDLKFDGATSVGALDSGQKRVLSAGFFSALMLLEERYGDLALTLGQRAIISAAFAEKNEGLILEGPAWALDANEAAKEAEGGGLDDIPDEPASSQEQAAAPAADGTEAKENGNDQEPVAPGPPDPTPPADHADDA